MTLFYNSWESKEPPKFKSPLVNYNKLKSKGKVRNLKNFMTHPQSSV